MLSVVMPQDKITHNEKIVWLNQLLSRIEKHNEHRLNRLANGEITQAQYNNYANTKYNPRKQCVVERLRLAHRKKRDAAAGLSDYEPDQDTVNLNNCFEDIG